MYLPKQGENFKVNNRYPNSFNHPGGRRLASTGPPWSSCWGSSSSDLIGVLGIAIKPILLQVNQKTNIASNINRPVRAASRIPKGFNKLRKASTLEVFAVSSTITLFSLTSTIFAPNCVARTEMECICWCFKRSACDGVMGGWWSSGWALRSKLCARIVSRSNFVSAESSLTTRRGSWNGPPTNCSSRYSGPRMDTFARRSSREITLVSV